MRLSRTLFLLSMFLVQFLVFLPVDSADAAGLVPCGRTEDDLSTQGIDERAVCTLCHMILGTRRLMDWGLWVMTAIALTVITAMGIWYVVSVGDEGMIKQAKEGIKASLIGMAIMLGAWLIVSTTILVLANGQVTGLKRDTASSFGISCSLQTRAVNGVSAVTSGGVTTGTTGAATSGKTLGGGISCTDPEAFKQTLALGGKVCSGSCLKGKCSFDAAVLSAIEKYHGSIPINIVKAQICQESDGVVSRTNDKGVVTSCGLMQVNTNEVGNDARNCLGPKKNLLDPEVNIQEGVKILEQKISRSSGFSYGGGITGYNNAFAAYNCCQNGDNPNAASVSCKTVDGWPSLPKWACPIDPGEGQYNMCAVKRYACDIEICATQY